MVVCAIHYHITQNGTRFSHASDIHIIIEDHPHRVVFFCRVWLYRWHFVCHIKPSSPSKTPNRVMKKHSALLQQVHYTSTTPNHVMKKHTTPRYSGNEYSIHTSSFEATSTLNIRDGPPITMHPCGSGGRGGVKSDHPTIASEPAVSRCSSALTGTAYQVYV